MTKIMKQFLNHEDLSPCIRDIFTEHLVPCTIRSLEEGEILWGENENHPYIYLIQKGMIKLHVINKEGREKALFYYTSGSCLGFQSLSKEKITVTIATAILPTTLYAVSFSQFYKFISENPQYLSAITSYIFHHMMVEAQEIVNISLYSTSERLTALLVHLTEEYQKNDQGEVLIPFNNEDLGSMVGACRNSVTNAISGLQRQGLIRKQRGKLIITDLKRLREHAQ